MVQSIIIEDVKLSSVQIPLVRPFHFANQTVYERQVLYFTFTTRCGLTVISEAAPLAGVSAETFKKAEHDAQVGIAFLIHKEFDCDLKVMLTMLSAQSTIRGLCASVRCAIEAGLCLLAAKAQNVPLAQWLGGQIKDVPVAALLEGTHDEVVAMAKEYHCQGFQCYKLKAGNRNIPLDVKKIQDVRAVIGEQSMIRVDANRVWSFNEASLYVSLVGHAQLDFIEEPLSDMGRLHEFYEATHMPCALDETLSIVRPDVLAPGRCMPTLADAPGIKTYVIKPMVLGFIASLQWMDYAKRRGKNVVISSTFESSVGICTLAQLACLTDQPAGLGTLVWLEDVGQNIAAQGFIPAHYLL